MILRILVLGILTLSLSACNISGSGQKGPFNTGSNVTVSQLNNQALPITSTTLNSHVTGSQGNYSVDQVQWDGWTEVGIEGTYFDEFTGTDGVGSLSLRAITRKDNRFDTANVHLFSHLAAARMQQRVADGQNNNQAWRSTQQEMKDFFGFQRVSQNYQRGVEQLSLLAGTGRYRRDNANLLLFTGSFLATDGNAASLQLLADDFADDAQFNGVGAGAFNSIAVKGSATGLLTTLSNNLKNHGARNPPNTGDMASLPKWVVVDAGDVTPPVISILGDNPVEIEVGVSYVDAGATATDDVDEVVEVIVVGNSDVIDTSEAGTFIVTYQATDAANNSSTATRTVIVNAVNDTTPPVITVTGLTSLTIVVGTPYVDEGATAIDDVDGEVAVFAIDGSDVIDTSVPSTHIITYRATDLAENSAIETRTVEVVEASDDIPPVITLLGDTSDTVEVDVINEVPVPYEDPGYTASDNRDGEVNVVVDGLDAIDRSILGSTYTITYTATDAAENTTVESRTVTVFDTTSPVITLIGDATHTVFVDNSEVPAPYQDLGAVVEDNYDSELAFSVDVSLVDTGSIGFYTLVYTATDSSGNASTPVERVVNVVDAPNEAPTVNAGTDTTVQVNSAVTLTGVGEDVDGTITYSWTENGIEISTTPLFNYTPTTEGTHTLTLTVTDNDSATASDNVIVTATLPMPYQIVFVSDTTPVSRNLDANLFSQGLLINASVVDGSGATIAAEPSFDPSVVDLSTPGTYPMIFSFIDPIGREITKTLTVIVENHTPLATSSSTTVDEDSSNNPITLIAHDTDLGDTLTYTVTQPANGTVAGTAPNVTYTPDADFAGTDSFTFTVSDGIAESTGTITITVTDIPEPNIAPTANAGADTTVQVNSPVTLTGSGTDTDGTVTSYSWSENGNEIATTASFSYTPATEGTHTLTLTVTDDDGATGSDVVVVEATEPADTTSPVITLNGDNPDTVFLDASGLSPYQDPGATATDDRDLAPVCCEVTGSVDTTQLGTYTLTYYAIDSSENTASKTRTVHVVLPIVGYTCPATTTTELGYTDSFVANATEDTPWALTQGPITVQDIENTFNVARAIDASGVQGQKLKMPEQAVWDAFTGSEKALFLINSERCARGIRPYEGISPEVVISPAQTYAQYLADNDVFSHEADGRTPWVRLTEDAGVVVGSNADFFSFAENLAFVSSGSTGAHPTIYEPIARSIYGYIYDDKDDTGGSYGHRAFVLATGLEENSGQANQEGLIGMGKAEIQTTQVSNGNTFNVTKVYSVMNGFDPNENWDMDNVQSVGLTETDTCLAGYTSSTVTNPDGSTSFVCSVDAVATNRVSGRVTSTTGAELLGVSVKVLQNGVLQNEATNTAANGGFDLDLASNTEFTLTFTAAGYANQVQSVKTPANGQSVNIDITLIARGGVQTLSEDNPVTIGMDGALVSLPDNSFVDSLGNTVLISDGINVTITPVDVSTPVGVAAFPGDFSGVPEGQGTATPILSYGTVEYQFTRASDGAVLQLGAEQQAQIEIPIYTKTHQDGTPIAAGDTIPLWSLDEETGIWTQEGTGTVIISTSDNSPTGLAMLATVSHFTWWNCDVTMNAANAIVTVTAPESGAALIKARTNADIGGWRPNTVDTVITVGASTSPLPIPSNGEVCFWAEISFTSGNNATTPEICVTAAPNATVNVNLQVAGGTLGITSSPDTAVTTFINVAPVQIKLQPTTSESDVIYSVLSGQLPFGVSLVAISSTSAVISGIPTQADEINPIIIQGLDSDGNTATVSLTYNVIDAVQPPTLQTGSLYTDDGIFFEPSERDEFVNVESNKFITNEDIPFALIAEGGEVTSWGISNINASEGGGGIILGVGSSPVPLSGQGIAINASTGVLSVDWDQVTAPEYSGGDYVLKFTLTGSNAGGSDVVEVEILRVDIGNVGDYVIVFNQNPVSVSVGTDPGTFFFEILPLGIIDGVYDSNGNQIASGGAVDCNSNDVDLNTTGTYEMNCEYADEVLGFTESILTVIVTPPIFAQ